MGPLVTLGALVCGAPSHLMGPWSPVEPLVTSGVPSYLRALGHMWGPWFLRGSIVVFRAPGRLRGPVRLRVPWSGMSCQEWPLCQHFPDLTMYLFGSN